MIYLVFGIIVAAFAIWGILSWRAHREWMRDAEERLRQVRKRQAEEWDAWAASANRRSNANPRPASFGFGTAAQQSRNQRQPSRDDDLMQAAMMQSAIYNGPSYTPSASAFRGGGGSFDGGGASGSYGSSSSSSSDSCSSSSSSSSSSDSGGSCSTD